MLLNKFCINEYYLSTASGEISACSKNVCSNAFALTDKITLTIKIPRILGTTEVKVSFFNENLTELILSINAAWNGFHDSNDVYKLSLNAKSLGVGLFFYEVKLNSVYGIIYAHKGCGNVSFLKNKPSDKFQLTVSDFEYSKPESVYGGIIYHIFVDRFARDKNKVSLIGLTDWDAPIPEYPKYPGANLKNTYLYGGDLWGVAQKLDYLKKLGVSIIYLSPIFESPSNHKYDTADYMNVDTAFGGNEAFENLIQKAKKMGISVILDGVFNHTGSDSKYFNKYGTYSEIGAYNSKNSKYYEWYDFKSYPNDYTSWWGIDILPRINPDIPSLKNYLSGDGGVIEKYMKLGILGFRLDVVDELSDNFVASIKKRLDINNKGSFLIGEVWEDASNKIAYGKRKRYYLGNELDSVMNYPTRNAIISFLKDNDDSQLKYLFYEVMPNAPKRIRDAQMNIIGTHDTERILTVLGGESREGKSNTYLSKVKMTEKEYDIGRKKLLMAYTFIATIPGIPSIYYGDEAGVQGYSDPFNRRPYPWDNTDEVILEHYKNIGKIRRENDIYKDGEFKLHYLNGGVLIFSRYDTKESFITIINNSNDALSIAFSKKAISLSDCEIKREFIIQPFSSQLIKASAKTKLEIKRQRL